MHAARDQAGPCGDPRFARPPRHPATVPHASSHHFAIAPDRVWDAIDDVRRFPRLWSWLRAFEAGGDRLQPGLVMRGTVVAPVPYRMRLTVEVDEVSRGHWVRATVRGDLAGPAAVEIRETARGCELTVCWRAEIRRPAMRAAAHVVRPVLVWGHDRIVETTVRSFRHHLEATA